LLLCRANTKLLLAEIVRVVGAVVEGYQALEGRQELLLVVVMLMVLLLLLLLLLYLHIEATTALLTGLVEAKFVTHLISPWW
jgi:hypothetical protein